MKLRFLSLVCGTLLYACGTIKTRAPGKEQCIVDPNALFQEWCLKIDVPLEIDLGPYLQLAENNIDKTFRGGESPCQGLRYQYKMDRGKLSLNGKGGNRIGLGLDLTYAVKGEYCAMCFGQSCAVPTVGVSLGYGEPMKKAHVGMESSIEILSNYQIKTKSKITELIAIDPIKLPLGIDVTNLIFNQAKPYVNEAMKMVDLEVSKIDVRGFIDPAFKEMQNGISLNGMGYLMLNPQAIAISPLEFNKNTMKASVSIKASPEIKSEVSTSRVQKLPGLTKYQKGDGFKVYTDVRMHYDSLAHQVMDFIKGQKFESGSQYIVVTRLRLFAVESRLGVEVDFEGSKKGTLYLTGIPVYDSISQHIRVDDLQFDLKTKNILLKSAKWILSDKIRKEMQKAMNIDMKPQINEAKKMMNEALNTQYEYGIKLSGKINELKITDYQLRAEELWVRVFLQGGLKVNLQSPNRN